MRSCLRLVILSMMMVCLTTAGAAAFEIITKKDIIQGVVVREDLIKTADNAIILFDSSSSMDKPYKGTGMTRYEVAKNILEDRNGYIPDLGYNFGLYLYTPWKEVYPLQPYDREKFAASLETLPEKARTGTFLTDGLRRLDKILASLEGRTAVFLFTDGSYRTKGAGMKSPAAIAESLSKKYNVCFYIVSTADDSDSVALFSRIREFNFCSRIIAFEDFINHPQFNSEALFTVKATKNLVTLTDRRVVGIRTRSFLFDFDMS
ncbi:MAG: VWA domain-containing protein, partial [Desulfobacterales bacterium]|nr:VWA domain-containing protein [Desulfobacterales bacterium]